VTSPAFSSLMSPTLPLDMLGGFAKANTWVVRPRGSKFFYSAPSTYSGAWLKANLRVVRPVDLIPNEYLPSVAASMLGR
jgi:hypothetical protein